MLPLAVLDFIGRFHPLLVHLPIGILLLAALFQWLLLQPRFFALKAAIPVMLFWGALGGVGACISGYLLSQSGDYDVVLVNRHQWLGIWSTVAAVLLYLLYRVNAGEWVTRIAGLLMLALVFVTGHAGGALTHGEGYLLEAWEQSSAKGPLWPKMDNVQEAVVYEDLVKPLLAARCYSCHGSSKQKGKLRLDSPDGISKGGEEGKVINPGHADESSLLERLLLPIDDDDHMPPREKPQLSKAEIDLLHWWVQSGASFSKKAGELEQSATVKAILSSIASGLMIASEKQVESDLPAEPVAAADPVILERLKEQGVMVLPVAANSNYLQAGFFTARGDIDSLLRLTGQLKKQLISLKLSGAALSDSSLRQVAACENLRILQLNDTPVSDAGLAHLASLKELRSLNLVGTKVSAAGLKALSGLKNLRHIYLYKTAVTAADFQALKQWMPDVRIDTGGYKVPTFETDTTLLKY